MSSPNPRYRRPLGDDADDAYERVVPFGGSSPRQRTARAVRSLPGGGEPGFEDTPPRRRARRRQTRGAWLQRNALSIAALAVIVVLLGVGFGIAHLLANPGTSKAPTSSIAAAGQPTSAPAAGTAQPAVTVITSAPGTQAQQPAAPGAAAVAPTAAPPAPAPTATPSGPRPVQLSTQTLSPNYTVKAGDTLNGIAARFHTTAERVAALNHLTDPRKLSIGEKLVIPPPTQ